MPVELMRKRWTGIRLALTTDPDNNKSKKPAAAAAAAASKKAIPAPRPAPPAPAPAPKLNDIFDVTTNQLWDVRLSKQRLPRHPTHV